MCKDIGIEFGIRINTDATAAKGISMRVGLGKLRHIDINQLWVQEKVKAGEISIIKVSTHENLADALTKHVNGQLMQYHMRKTNNQIMEGRHSLMPNIECRLEESRNECEDDERNDDDLDYEGDDGDE